MSNAASSAEVFLSHSGVRSTAVAKKVQELGKTYLPKVTFHVFQPPFGDALFVELHAHLQSAKVCVPCVTPENQDSPWVHFEAGAFASAGDKRRVIPLLLDVDASALKEPLKLFGSVHANAAGVGQLMRYLADLCNQTVSRIEERVAADWEQFAAQLSQLEARVNHKIDCNNYRHVALRRAYTDLEREGTSLRRLVARRVLSEAATAAQALQARILISTPRELADVVLGELNHATEVIALCGGKPWDEHLRIRYYRQCFAFAERVAASTGVRCLTRLFPAPDGNEWPANEWSLLVEHWRRRDRGVCAKVFRHQHRMVDPEIAAVVTDVVSRNVGCIFLRCGDKAVAFSHRGGTIGQTEFKASQWHSRFALQELEGLLRDIEEESIDFVPRAWNNYREDPDPTWAVPIRSRDGIGRSREVVRPPRRIRGFAPVRMASVADGPRHAKSRDTARQTRKAKATIPTCISLFGPKGIRPGCNHAFALWLYSFDFRNIVRDLAMHNAHDSRTELDTQAAVNIKIGSRVRATFELLAGEHGQILAASTAEAVWTGAYLSLNANLIPKSSGAQSGVRISVRLEVEGFQVAAVDAALALRRRVRSTKPTTKPVSLCRSRLPQSAFASYAREDRKQVILVKQVLENIFPGFDLFVDCASVRAGGRWSAVLYREIKTRDIFMLFWSTHAQQSNWVRREWRYALRKRGLDCIKPVALVQVEQAPPPPELQRLHFDDLFNPARFAAG